MEVGVNFTDGFDNVLSADWLRFVAAAALRAERRRKVEMSVLITGQEEMRRLHRDYMGEDETTDVLSFAMLEKASPDAPEFVFPKGEVVHLGEVIISYPQAELQAAEHWHSARREVAILLIHGVLHLLGYDHDTPERQAVMQAHEKAIIENIGEDLN
ncbi:MAG: rRNA maturation RNase YbeY [Dehalococcoidia bacterium]|nr:rRNA maturation RNase YbeY [Dehalococcoidia bacterium]